MAFRELEERLDEEKPLRTFQVTLNIRVRSDNDFDPKLLSDYLQAAVQILIEQDRRGTGAGSRKTWRNSTSASPVATGTLQRAAGNDLPARGRRG